MSGASSIARWDGSQWRVLGSGVGYGLVCAITVSGSDVYVGGSFTSAGGVSGANNVARWNGSQWYTVGAPGAISGWGREGTGRNPTERGKRGTKRSLRTDGHGIPFAITVDTAKRHDSPMVQRTLAALPIVRPQPTDAQPQHLWMDQGDNAAAIRTVVAAWGATAHIQTHGEEATAKQHIPAYRRARRWVVERTPAWLNRFRRLLIRWAKKVENDLAMLHVACAWISFRAAKVFG